MAVCATQCLQTSEDLLVYIHNLTSDYIVTVYASIFINLWITFSISTLFDLRLFYDY